ncbi:S8 family peptidase [Sediminibacillus massiliensis]|uniref:S8 family peptidase n=1 Tax=Sediminibacillus massiliensis TaxID=1926277 RepID=UPI00098870AD|nr:S8 family peptidase [Sediminibacillus massiliensis]
MFNYSMVQMARTNARRLDRPLREEILNIYKPFKWMPCFLHKVLEGSLRRSRNIPVIIEFEKECYLEGCAQVDGIMKKHRKNKIKRHFSRIGCCSARVTPNSLNEILSTCSRVKKVHLNRKVHALLDVAVPSANASNVKRDNQVLTGKGVNIAILDTGIHPHQDLNGRITGFKDLVKGRTEPYDDNGHGTHCAGDAAGNGSASSSRYKGPAPEATLTGVKVLDKRGSGSLDTVIEGVDWCIQYNEENPKNKIDIISMSLGSSAQPFANEDLDPMVQMVEEAWAAGITVCVAAGNEGPDSGTISSPGISDRVITVGALDDRDTSDTKDDDDVADFSSRGPTIYGIAKPDILAPGVNIVSLRSPRSYIDKLQKANRVGDEYFVMSGTSMATPICAGVVALMKQHNPELQPDDMKDLLLSGADLWEGKDRNIYGAGYINAERSIPQ